MVTATTEREYLEVGINRTITQTVMRPTKELGVMSSNPSPAT